MNIIGNINIASYFDKVIKKDKVHHAYCLVGPTHIGKMHLAKQVAKKMLQVDKLEQSPDFIVVQNEINKKTGKTKKDISIEQIKHLRHFLSMTSASSGYKVAIIRNAEKMNISASNALLKTLEEPTKNTVIILTTKDNDLLLPTILSRSHVVHMTQLLQDKMSSSFFDDYNSDHDFKYIIALSHGLPGLAITLFTDQEKRNMYLQEVNRFYSFIDKPFSDKLNLVNSLFGDKSDHILQRQYIIEVLDLWLVLLRDIAQDKQFEQSKTVANSFSNEIIVKLLNKITSSKIQLHKNIHPRLIIEQILLLIP